MSSARVIEIQTASFADGMDAVGGELVERTKRPFPFFVNEDGTIRRQDFWRGAVARVVGFAKDVGVQQIDVWWSEVVADPAKAVGLYVVTADTDGNYSTHSTAVESATVLPEGEYRA